MSIFDDLGGWLSDNASTLIPGLIGAWAGSQDGQDRTVTQAPYLYPGQEEGIANVINLAKQEYQGGPMQYYPGNPVSPLDPNIIAGQNAQLGSLGVQQQLADLGTYGAGDLLQGGAGRIEGFDLPDQIGFGIDPGLENAVMNPIMRNLTERVLPSLDLQATNQGAFGGTRHALLKGQAAADSTERAAEAVARANLNARGQSIQQRQGDVSSMLSGRSQDINQNQIYNNAIGAGINAIPGAMTAQLAPGALQQEIGTKRTAYEQQLINADKARFDFNQQAPIDALTRLQSRMTLAAPGGSMTTTPGDEASWLSILGGFGTGAQLGQMFAGSGGASSAGNAGQFTPAPGMPGGWNWGQGTMNNPQYGWGWNS